MRRTVIVVVVPLLALALGACSSSGDDGATPATSAPVAAVDGGSTTTTVQGTGEAPADTAPPSTGGYSPTTATSIDPGTLPGPAQAAGSWGGGDAVETNCINATISEALEQNEEQASRNDVVAGMAGHAIVTCLPPQKLGAVTTEKLRNHSVGASLSSDQLSCVTSALTGGDPLDHTVFIGGLVVGDAAIIRQGASGIDATCGTNLAGS